MPSREEDAGDVADTAALLGRSAVPKADASGAKVKYQSFGTEAPRRVSDMPSHGLQEFTHGDIAGPDQDDLGVQPPSRAFIWNAMFIQIMLIVLFSFSTDYPAPNEEGEDTTRVDYPMYQQIHVMMFIGFGYLMTFLARYSYGAIGINMLLSALAIQWGAWCFGLVDVLFTGKTHKLMLDTDALAQGDIACAAVLISFGAVIGRATPLQLIWMAVVEIVFYAINNYLCVEILGVSDVGGSIVVHTFGCYFGLAVSFMLGAPKQSEVKFRTSTYQTDLFSMIGTIFLWLYWPSFNGIFAATDGTYYGQNRAVVNTVFSLAACTVTTFAISQHNNSRFSMTHLQNSTLAGGVAVGASANLYCHPSGAMAIGVVAAILSCYGFDYIDTYIVEQWNLYDTCGINYLHGMPGVLGGIVSAIVIAAGSADRYNDDAFAASSFGAQAGVQIIGLLITFAIAIVSGCATGALLKGAFSPVKAFYQDHEWYLVAQSYLHKYNIGKGMHEAKHLL